MALLAALALGGVGAAAPTANLSCAAGGTAKYDVHRANLTVAAAAAWCRNSSRCAGFAAEATYPGACTADASAVLDCHFMDSWAARRRGSDAAWTYWGVPGPRPTPPPKPYPTPPNPCGPKVSDSPKYHIMNLGIGPHDLNSIVHWRGMWHVIHSRHAPGQLDGLGASRLDRPCALDAAAVGAEPERRLGRRADHPGRQAGHPLRLLQRR